MLEFILVPKGEPTRQRFHCQSTVNRYPLDIPTTYEQIGIGQFVNQRLQSKDC